MPLDVEVDLHEKNTSFLFIPLSNFFTSKKNYFFELDFVTLTIETQLCLSLELSCLVPIFIA